MTEAHLFAIGILLAWLAGIRVYLTVFGVGIAGLFGWLDLPPALEVATSPWVLGISGVLAVAEFFADKIPGVDSGWDLLQTLARVPAGAFLAAATLSDTGELGVGALALVFAHPWWALGLLLAVLVSTALVVGVVVRWLWRRLRPAPALPAR